MAETYARPRFGEPREPKNRVNPGSRLIGVIDFVTGSHVRADRVPDAVRSAAVPARILQHPADRSRRGAIRAGHQADGRDRRFRRHPFPGRRALQEAGRHLLAAGRRGRNRLGAGLAARPGPDLAVPRSLPDRRDRSGAADLLDGAGIRDPARSDIRRAHPVQFGAAWRRSAARQNRRHAAADRGRGDGGAGAGLFVLAARRGSRASVMDMARDFLDRAGWRRAAQGTVDPDVRGADDRHAGDPRPVGGLDLAAASGLGPDVDAGAGAALVRRDLLARRRCLLRRIRSAATC